MVCRFRVARKFKGRHTGIRSHLREGLNALVVLFFAFNLSLLVQMAIFYWQARSLNPAQLLTGISTLTNVAVAVNSISGSSNWQGFYRV